MNEELISVIVPVYNGERYLAACLDSILTQSYRNLEVVLIDDGSTDFSLKIAQEYAEKDSRLKIFSYENEGQAEARNHGLSLSSGNLLLFVDADDMLLPDSIEIMYSFLYKYDADIVEGKLIKGTVHGEFEFKGKISSKTYSAREAIEKVLYQTEMLPSPCAKLYKAKLFDNLRFIKGIIYEDLDIFYKIFERAEKIVYISYPVYFYRNNEKSTTNVWKPQRLDVLKVTEDLENYISEKYPDLLPSAKDRRLSANFNMYALCSIHGEHDHAHSCWEHIRKNRRQSLFNPNVRLKNKAGIILSYLGRPIFNLAARRIYR